jgi:hypothetical protein
MFQKQLLLPSVQLLDALRQLQAILVKPSQFRLAALPKRLFFLDDDRLNLFHYVTTDCLRQHTHRVRAEGGIVNIVGNVADIEARTETSKDA